MQGQYFDKKTWDGAPLPTFASAKPLLPDPIFPDDDALAMYWQAWQLAIGSMKSPAPGSGFVSNFLYMEFSNSIFAHDTAIMVMFARYGHRAFPPAGSLDNFYSRQHETGEICREIRLNGEDYWPNRGGLTMRINQTQDGMQHYDWTPPNAQGRPAEVAVEGLNDPSAMLWAEWSSYQITGDRERLARILPAQCKWFEAFETYLRDGDEDAFYITDWASVDNAPRNKRNLAYGVDVASQQAFLARLLSEVCQELGEKEAAGEYRRRSEQISRNIRRRMWNEQAGFFFDLDREGNHIPVKGAFGFFPMMTDAPGPAEIARLVEHLNDPRTFNRPVRVPSLSADERDYCPQGAYLLGGVWPFINATILAGLERHGQTALAAEIALNYWNAHRQVFRDTGTVWEFIAPEKPEPGGTNDPHNPGVAARRDFAGWGAYSPIAHLLEYAIGLRPNAPANTLTWNLRETRACGCHRYAFGDVITDVLCEPRANPQDEPVLRISTNKPFTLVLNWGEGRHKVIHALGGTEVRTDEQPGHNRNP